MPALGIVNIPSIVIISIVMNSHNFRRPSIVQTSHYCVSWLRVSGTTKMPQIDHGVRHQLHTVMALLFELEA